MRVLKSRPMTGFKAVQSNMAVDNPRRMDVGTVYSTKSMALADHNMFCFDADLEDAVRVCLYSTAFKVYRCKVWGTVLDVEGRKIAQHIQLECELPMRKLLKLCNKGVSNLGLHNSGSFNFGDCNDGNQNYGDHNFGSNNVGSYNDGSGNCGSHNSGNYNLGNYNEGGGWNAACHTESCFFTTKSHVAFRFFNKPYSDASFPAHTPDFLNIRPAVWIPKKDMTDKHKRFMSRSEDVGGCTVYFDYKTAFRISFADARRKPDWPEQLEMLKALPNFDAGIFKEITGIKEEELGL